MNTTDGIYTDFRKLERGVKLYMKISQPIAYGTFKLVQFLARAVKEKYFSQDMVENFAEFMKTTNGEFSIYRMPYASAITREKAIENAKNYFDKAGIEYCIMDSANEKDNALHISVARKDEQKFNLMFTDYLKEQLPGGEKTADDLVNLTDGKTTIISIPEASLDIIKNALTEVNVNFAELPDLIPDDGEKQLRIANADLDVAKQCCEAYAVKEKYFNKDMVENFAEFMKTTNGEFSIYRMPYVSAITREKAIENAKNYFDKAGIEYSIMGSVSDKDNALHISVARKDEQKFNAMFTDYLKEQLSGGEKTAGDLVNLTDGKTTIISIPEASLAIMKSALTEVNVNFAELPDLVPDDDEKQLRIASTDLNVTKQCYEAYRRSLIKNKPEEAAAEMKVFSEDDYTDGAKETTEQYMKNSVSDELKEKLQKYEKFDANEMERELMKWDTMIKDSKGFECQALRSNMAYSEISIDWKTLINDNPINNQMERKFPKFIFATIPGTQGQQIVMLPKNQVFKVENEERYIAFVNNQKKVRTYNINGNKLEFDPGETYPTGKDLLKKFDVKETNPEQTAKAMAETVEKVMPDIKVMPHISEAEMVEKVAPDISEAAPAENDTPDIFEAAPAENDTSDISETAPAENDTPDISETALVENDMPDIPKAAPVK